MKIEIKLKYNMYSNYKNYRKGELLIIDSYNNLPKGSYEVIREINDDKQGYDDKMMNDKIIKNKMMNTKNKKTKVK